MTENSTRIPMLLGALVVLTGASGCSIIGFTAGASIDANTPDTSRYSAHGLDSVKVGTTVTVIRMDTSQVEGEYAGTEDMPWKDYVAAYDQYRLASSLGSRLPALGDSICIITRSVTGRRRVTEALFEGFGRDGVRFSLPRTRQLGLARAAFIDTLYMPGGIITGEQLRQGPGDGGGIPRFIKALRVTEMSGESVSIPLNEVLEVRTENARYAKFLWLAVGAAVDIVIIAAIASIELGP